MKRSPEDEQLFNSLIDQINQLQETIAQLNEQIKNLNRRSFGTSSEKTSANCNSKLASADKAHRRKGSWEFQVDQD